VEGDVGFLLGIGIGRQTTSRDEFLNQFGVMDDFVVAAKLMILLAQVLQAVRASHDDARRFNLVQQFDIATGEFKVEVFLTGTAGDITGAVFLLSPVQFSCSPSTAKLTSAVCRTLTKARAVN